MEKNSKYSTAFHDLKQIALKSASVFSEKLLGYQNNPWHIRIMYAICDNILVQEPSIIGEDGKEKLGKIVFNSEAHGWKINLKIVIEIPRNHGKSTAISVNWSLKEVYKDPNIRILTASNTEGQSSSFLREQVGYIERCERLNEVMGKIKPN